MRILVISDIHANQTALEAVLHAAGEVEAHWCLGDIVGYGPDPNECVERVCSLSNLTCILGNHDAAALNRIDTETFNPEARQAIEWTQSVLTESNRRFLSNLPEIVLKDQVTLVHGSPRHSIWEYLLDTRTAAVNFEYFRTPYCFVGHTHYPVLFQRSEEQPLVRLRTLEPNTTLKLEPRAIVNPGSVGQPRDRDPRASFAIFDSEQDLWEYHRVEYEIPDVQKRMMAAGLPERHISRLSAGW